MKSYEKIKPAFAECKNCIILCSDDGFMPATSVLIQSIFEQADSQKFYDIIIFHSNIRPVTEEIVQNMFDGARNFSVRFVNVASIVVNINFYTANRNNFTSEAYYRLFAPWLLDEEYEKAFYIDGDMVAVKDVSTVFDIDIGDNLIGAIRDYWGICNCYIPDDPRREYRESIGLDDIDNYVISCTILFNLAKFRKQFTLEQVINLSACKNWLQHDQDVLNILCRDSIFYLTADWGLMNDYGNNHYLPQYLIDELAEVTNPVLIHFGGVRKPWSYNYHEHGLDFWQYADHTPYMPVLFNKINSMEYRGYVAQKIFSDDIFRYYDGKDLYRMYKGVSLGTLGQCHSRYCLIKIKNNILHLEGMVGFWGEKLDSKIAVFFEINEEIIPASKQYKDNGYERDKNIYKYRGELFELDYPLSDDISEYNIKLICEVDGVVVAKENLGFENFSPLNRRFVKGYYQSGDWIVLTDKKTLTIQKADKSIKKQCEKQFCHELWNSKNKANRKAVIVRKAVAILRKFIRKPIWLISDRTNKADENGEAFFRYLNAQKRKAVKSYFVLSKNSPDYNRIRKYGKVVEPYSHKHKMLHLLAQYSVSSQTDDIYRNPFKEFKEPYRDILSDIKFIFLQHGVISNDLSDWLCRRTQYLSGFVCTTQKEYDSIINGNYNYDSNVVWLTGLPRFDLLENRPDKTITIMPTWRMYLTIKQDAETGIWQLRNNFPESTYVNFYRDLLQSSVLQETAQKLGYKLQIKLHPCFSPHAEEFGFAEYVNIVGDDVSYREIYSQSSLVVTDYSSAIYDFLYLHKPVMYTQFDSDEFFSGKHIYDKGDFDYERDGFGEVEYDLASTINRIIEYMQNDCQLKEKYRERIDKFFVFNDKNNCQRIYERIINLDK